MKKQRFTRCKKNSSKILELFSTCLKRGTKFVRKKKLINRECFDTRKTIYEDAKISRPEIPFVQNGLWPTPALSRFSNQLSSLSSSKLLEKQNFLKIYPKKSNPIESTEIKSNFDLHFDLTTIWGSTLGRSNNRNRIKTKTFCRSLEQAHLRTNMNLRGK